MTNPFPEGAFTNDFDLEHDCPNCDAHLEASSGINGTAPAEDDLSLCIECGAWFIFGEGMKPRQLDEDEMEYAMADPIPVALREAWIKTYKKE